MANFTKARMADFDRYEQVRQSGAHNMLSKEAMEMSGLSRDRYLFVITNYSAMARQKEGIKKR